MLDSVTLNWYLNLKLEAVCQKGGPSVGTGDFQAGATRLHR